MKTSIVRFMALLLCVAAGCNQSSEQSIAEPATDQLPSSPGQTTFQATAAQFESPATDTPPANVVIAFLTALRDGDETTASALLTATARTETAKHELVVQPPGAPTAEFRIGQVEFVGQQKNGQPVGVHVHSTWTEDDGQGGRFEYDVVWALRRDTEGWRIAGLAAPLAPNERPVFLNFEDPADMLAKQRQAQQTLANGQEGQPVMQAQPATQDPPIYR